MPPKDKRGVFSPYGNVHLENERLRIDIEAAAAEVGLSWGKVPAKDVKAPPSFKRVSLIEEASAFINEVQQPAPQPAQEVLEQMVLDAIMDNL